MNYQHKLEIFTHESWPTENIRTDSDNEAKNVRHVLIIACHRRVDAEVKRVENGHEQRDGL
jgi:hypothetical protein